MGIKFANHANTVTLSDCSESSTEVTIQKEDVPRFPILGAGDYFYVSAILPGHRDFVEIIKVIEVDTTTGVMQIVRGMDGTAPQILPSGSTLEIRIPAAALHDILAVAEEGIDGPRLERFEMGEVSSEWLIEHGRGTTLFEERVWVKGEDSVYRRVLAPTTLIDQDSFKIEFTHPVVGYVDVRF